MIDNRKDLPPVKDPQFLQRVRESLMTYLGSQGDPLKRGVMVGDLVDSGIINVSQSWLTGKGGGLGITPGDVIAGDTTDLTPPPTPGWLKVDAAITNIFIETQDPTFRQGGGYLKTNVYGATWESGPLPVFADAVKITEFTGSIFAHPSNPATTWHIWVTWVSKAGVESVTPAGGTNGKVCRTGEDVAKLLEALTGEITESQLYQDLGDRIDLIDGGGVVPALPYSLVELAALQESLNQQVAQDINQASTDLLESLVTIQNTNELVRDAGVYTDPADGLVKIYGVEAANDHLNTVDIRLDSAEAQITLRATQTYVDNAIATAVIDPSQVPVFTELEARVNVVEVDLDAAESAIALKASTLDLDSTNVRMTTAETNISSLTGTVSTKVDSSTFTAVTGGLDTRLGTAESEITSFGDESAMTNLVMHSSRQIRAEDADAETILREILNGEERRESLTEAIAYAKEDLRSFTLAGIEAEASKRLVLEAVVTSNASVAAASVLSESTARATADSALSSQITTLSATVGSNYSAVQTQITALANADTATASTITTLQSTVGTNTAAISTEASTRATQTGELYAQYTVKLDVGGKVSGFGLASSATSSEFAIRSNRFYIAPPSDPLLAGDATADIVPFIVQTTATNIGGQAVPAGVYMDTAFIRDGTISTAKIANLAVDDAKIANLGVNKLNAGAITAGQYITSPDFSAGFSGWRIHGNGTAEFAAASIRGQLVASQINTADLNVGWTNVTGRPTSLATLNSTDGTSLAYSIKKNAQSVLEGSGGISVGSLTWNSSGVRTSGYGVGFSQNGIAAYNSSGTATFVLNGATGSAQFSGDVQIGNAYLDGTTMGWGGNGAKIGSNGAFVLGGFYGNITHPAGSDTIYINGNVVATENLNTHAATYVVGSAAPGGTASVSATLDHDADVYLTGSAVHPSGVQADIMIDGSSKRGVLAQGSVAMVFKDSLSAGAHTFSTVSAGTNASIAVMISYR